MILSNKRQVFLYFIIILVSIVYPYPNFDEYVKIFKKSYPNDQIYQWRKSIYQKNIQKFQYITTYIPGVNNFTDLLQQQFRQMLGLKILPRNQRSSSSWPKLSQASLRSPLSLDHRNSNIVTSVKNQFSCGSCWAFTSVGLVESFLVKNGQQNITIDLSQQFLIECTSGTSGCFGGFTQRGLDRINKNCPLQKEFPYRRGTYSYGQKICLSNGIKTNFKRLSFYDLTDGQLIRLLNQGPVAVAVNSQNWKNYQSGIIKCSKNNVDHAVIAVGYTQNTIIIKNSWGTRWGQDGYVHVSRDPNNNCGVTHQAHILVKQLWEFYNLINIYAILLLLIFIDN